jgi:hypothetical protein
MTKEGLSGDIPKTIALRPRFQKVLDHNKLAILKLFEEEKSNQKDFIVSVVDDHIFIKLPKKEQHYWSPQLHLEINDDSDNSAKLYGLFGPNPTVWTMFMFLHFVVATLFFAAGIWAYSNWSLGKDYAIQVFLTLLTVVVWFVLYLLGRLGRSKGQPQMQQLNSFMEKTISKI